MTTIGTYTTWRSVYTCIQNQDGSLQIEKSGKEACQSEVSLASIPQEVKAKFNGDLIQSVKWIFANTHQYKPSFKKKEPSSNLLESPWIQAIYQWFFPNTHQPEAASNTADLSFGLTSSARLLWWLG